MSAPTATSVRRAGLVWAFAVALSAALGLAHLAPAREPVVEVHVLDVGQADGTVIFGTGGQVVVYDTGRNSRDLPAALTRLGVTAIDLLILSHQHADHIGGAAAVLQGWPVRYVIWNELPTTTQVHARTIAAMLEADVATLEPVRRRIGLGEANLHVLPPTGEARLDQDGNMVGLVLEHGDFRMIMAGDAYPVQWDAWLADHGDLLTPVQVLRASHHGSATGDTEASLAALRPQVVLISVGRDNPYGHPRPEALARYERYAHTILRTDEVGTIVVRGYSDGRFEVGSAH